MGVKGLWKALRPYVRDGHLSQFRGQRVAVDMYVWLHQSVNGCVCIHYDNLEAYLEAKFVHHDSSAHITIDELVFINSRYIDFIVNRVEALQKFGVVPVCVFDGTDVPMKQYTESERAQRRQGCFDDALHLLEDLFQRSCLGKSLSGVDCPRRTLNRRSPVIAEALQLLEKAFDISPELAHGTIQVLSEQRHVECIVAPYEADAELSYLCREGYVQAVISEDSDLIAYYCPCIIAKLANFTGRCEVIMPMDCVPVFYTAVAESASRKRRNRRGNTTAIAATVLSSTSNSNSSAAAAAAAGATNRHLLHRNDARRASHASSLCSSPSCSLSMDSSAAASAVATPAVTTTATLCSRQPNTSVDDGAHCDKDNDKKNISHTSTSTSNSNMTLVDLVGDVGGAMSALNEYGHVNNYSYGGVAVTEGGSSDSTESGMCSAGAGATEDAADGSSASASCRSYSYESFLLACVMSGCDYVPNLRSVGIMTAFKLVTQSSSLSQLMQTLEVEFGFPAAELRMYRTHVLSAFFCFAHHIVYCPLRKRMVHYHPLPLTSMLGSAIPPSLPSIDSSSSTTNSCRSSSKRQVHESDATYEGYCRAHECCVNGEEKAKMEDGKVDSHGESHMTACGVSSSSYRNSGSYSATSGGSSSSSTASTARPELTGQLWPAEVARQICEMCLLDPMTHKPYVGRYQHSVQEYLTRTRRGQTSLTAYEGFAQQESNKIVMRVNAPGSRANTNDGGFDVPLTKVSQAQGYIGAHTACGGVVGVSCLTRSKYFMRTRLELLRAESDENENNSLLGTVDTTSHTRTQDSNDTETEPTRDVHESEPVSELLSLQPQPISPTDCDTNADSAPDYSDIRKHNINESDGCCGDLSSLHKHPLKRDRVRMWHDVDANGSVSEEGSPVPGLLALLPSASGLAAREEQEIHSEGESEHIRDEEQQGVAGGCAAVPEARCACPFAYWQCNRSHSIFDQCFLGKQWVRGERATVTRAGEDDDTAGGRVAQRDAQLESGLDSNTSGRTTSCTSANNLLRHSRLVRSPTSYGNVITPYRAPRATTTTETTAATALSEANNKDDIFSRLACPRRGV